MAKNTLQEVLESTSELSSGMLVSSSLIKEMEVVGYVNSCYDEELLATHMGLHSTKQYRGIINHAAQSQIVCSNHLYQILPMPNGNDILMQGILSPIYKDLIIADEEMAINLESLELPFLTDNQLYRKIRARIGKGVVVDERMLRKANFPENIKAEDGKAILHIRQGEVLCRDKYQNVKSIGRNVLALCRYVHSATGNVCYAQFELTDLCITTD